MIWARDRILFVDAKDKHMFNLFKRACFKAGIVPNDAITQYTGLISDEHEEGKKGKAEMIEIITGNPVPKEFT